MNNLIPKVYAVVCRWKDNQKDVQVINYVSTQEEGNIFISKLAKPDKRYFQYEVMKYE
jgi:hypothetical protein